MKTFEEFARDITPDIDSRYDLYKLCQTPEKLIGLKVIAIRSGFSCSSEGGTKMTIESIDGPMIDIYNKKVQWVHLKPNNDTQYKESRGWMCTLDDLPHSVKPY